jgi:hypothetical protein
MKIISMHKVTPAMEAGERPTPELIRGMGALMGDLKNSGALVDGAGLLPSATRVRLRFTGGERTLEKGPYGGSNEVIAAVLMLTVTDMDEAIGWALRYGQALGDVELEIGPVTEPWDLGMMPKPAVAPLRCLLLHKGDAASEAGTPLSPAAATALSRVKEEMQKAGVLVTSHRLKPSSQGSRIKVTGKKPLIMDGPFAEAKELIAGFVILELPSVAAARPFNLRFAEVLGDVEMDVYVLAE